MAEKAVNSLLCSGLRSTDNAMGQVYQCWWRMCREMSLVLRFISICDVFTVSPSYTLFSADIGTKIKEKLFLCLVN
jgi:hypothetical protein